MIATGHALVGASLAVKIVNPVIGIPMAIASHFLLDLVPHWDSATDSKHKTHQRLVFETIIDVLCGFLLVFLLFRNYSSPLYLWTMVFAAQLPDWLESPTLFLGFQRPFSWVKELQMRVHNRLGLPWGLATLVIVLAIVIWALTPMPIGGFSASLFPTFNF